MRPGKAGWLILALILAPFPVIGDAECDEALSAMRNRPGAIHRRVDWSRVNLDEWLAILAETGLRESTLPALP
jgi:hypothetical protein